MHPCREYWGQDMAYGSLVSTERLRRVDRLCALPELYILDVDADSDVERHAELAGLVRNLCEAGGQEDCLRQSATHLKDFLQWGKTLLRKRLHAVHARAPSDDVRILGIATLHRRRAVPARAAVGELAGLATVMSAEQDMHRARNDRPPVAPPSSPLYPEFMRRLAQLGEHKDVSQIDWVVVRAGGADEDARAHLGVTRVSQVNVARFEPAPLDEASFSDPVDWMRAVAVG